VGRGDTIYKLNILCKNPGVFRGADQLLIHQFADYQMFSLCYDIEKSKKFENRQIGGI
jgi:hypothetical protein